MDITKILRKLLLGAMFALPFLAIFIIIEKIWQRFSGLSSKIGEFVGNKTLLGAYAETIFLIIFFLIAFYLIGNLTNNQLSIKLHKAIEKGILEYIPGYLVYKNKMAQALDTTSGERKAIYLVFEEEKKPAILIECTETEALAFVPGIPDTNSGEVVIVPIETVEYVDMPVKKFISHLQLTGKGLLKREDNLPI